MNKTFKVARSLTRGTVVTSEKASSYQGKAVKTVIAAAVALAAGSAFAIDNLSTVTLDNGTKITITTDAEGAYSSTVVGTVKGMNSQKPATEQQFDAGDRLNDDVKVTFKGGELEVVGTDKKVGTVDGAGTLSIISVSGKTDTAAKNATLTVGAAAEPVTLAGQTIVFGVSGTEAKVGTAKLVSVDALTLGTVDKKDANTDMVTPGKTTSVVVKAGTNAEIVAATDKALTIANATFANEGTLTFTGSTISVKSDIAAGNYVFAGATTIADAAVEGTKVGLFAADATADDIKGYDKVFKGNVTVDANGSLTAESLDVAATTTLTSKAAAAGSTDADGLVNAKTLNVAGTATLAGASVLGAVNVKNGGQLTLSGAVDAGDIAVDNTAVKEADAKATTLTIGSADATNVVAAKSLTVKGIAQNSGGSAVVSGNAVSIDTVTVGRFGTFELNAKELTVKDLTVGGELASDNTNAQNATLTLTSGSLTAENITIGAYSTTTNTANVDITTKELLKN